MGGVGKKTSRPRITRQRRKGSPSGRQRRKRGKEETGGITVEWLHRKIEERKLQKERRNISLWKKVQEGMKGFSKGTGELDQQAYAELLERRGFVLGLEADLRLVEQAGAEQDTQPQDTSAAEGPAQDTRQDQEAAHPLGSPNAGRAAPGGSLENQEHGSPTYPNPWCLGACRPNDYRRPSGSRRPAESGPAAPKDSP